MSFLRLAETGQRNGQPERQILINDLSGSMDEKDWKPSRLKAAIEAGIAFLEVKYRSYPEDEVGIVGFASNARIVHPPVAVGMGFGKLKDALLKMRTEGATNITAGLQIARSLLFPETGKEELNPIELLQRFSNWLFSEPPAPAAPKLQPGYFPRILVLTDGDHNTGSSPQPVAHQLKQRGVLIDCIGIGGSPESVNEPLLKDIASRNPDGSIRYCFIGDKSNLIQKYTQLANRIRPA